ncbi:MAG: hypothetical protein C5B59_19835 [Bacteroidetes bacterium]|nr:MAG: hypothetical protein C5B59_19835 [Bacteroidota bacterium]
MKHSSLTGLLFVLVTVFFLTSCGGGANEKTTTADSTAIKDSIAKAETAAKAMRTIITTPQNMMIVTHKVANYAKWLPLYESHDSVRLAHGIHNYVIGRGLKDSNMVMIAFKIDDTAKAKAFMKDPTIKKYMQKAGVISAPMATFLTATWQDTVTIETKFRSRTMFAVKDFDAWVKAFEEGKQERLDNGITDRVFGHDLNDNKKVTLVTAITDTAKASAYFKSDALKKRREAAGVIGEPDRFLFRIVKRY